MNERRVVQTDTENLVKLKSLHSVPKTMSIKQSESESANDQNIQTGKWTKGKHKLYLIVKNELTVIRKLVLEEQES